MQRDPFSRPLLWIAVIDLAMSVPIGAAWAIEYRVATPAAYLALTALRVLAWAWLLYRLLEPARAWQRYIDHGQRPDDAMLLAADACLQHAPRKFIVAY